MASKKLSPHRCQDFILIDRGISGTSEICGNSIPNATVSELQSGNFTVYFRTSEKKKLGGFEMYVICFREADRDRRGDSLYTIIDAIHSVYFLCYCCNLSDDYSTGCLTPMDFNSSVCPAGSGAGEMLPLGNSNATLCTRPIQCQHVHL